MRILIADDHGLVCDTVSAFLEHEPDISVDREADFYAALARIQADGPYDLVLLDYSMPGMMELQGVDRAKEANGGNPVAIISASIPHLERLRSCYWRKLWNSTLSPRLYESLGRR